MGTIQCGKLVIDGYTMSGAEELRLAISNMNVCREDFLDGFSATQLLQINRMLILSEWEIYPDQWTKRQVREALRGKPPQWDDDMKPVYG